MALLAQPSLDWTTGEPFNLRGASSRPELGSFVTQREHS